MKTSHIICILKIVTGLCLLKQRIKTKSTFVNVTVFLQCFSSEKVLTKHRENRLIINDKQNVKLGKGSISFKNYSKQLPAPFIICADFECILCPTLSKIVVTKIFLTQKNTKIIFFAVLPIKLFLVIINLVKVLFFIEEKTQLTNLLKQFLKSVNTVER